MAMVKINRIDWREVLFDLQRAGMKITEIAHALGKDEISERLLRYYREESGLPNCDRAELIITLWMQRTGKSREQAPTRYRLHTIPTARVVRQ